MPRPVALGIDREAGKPREGPEFSRLPDLPPASPALARALLFPPPEETVMLERILVPLDGSELAEGILGRLRPLLRRKDAEVLLARAVDVETSLARTDRGPRLAAERAKSESYLRAVELRLSGEGIRARGLVCEGPAEESLLAAASEHGADLIAMTTHGRSGIARWVFGSVTEKILRASPVPVLVVRAFGPGGAAPAAKDEIPFRRILLPTDGSEASEATIPAVVEFARLFGAEVVVLHVAVGAAVPVGAFAGSMIDPAPLPAFPPEDMAISEEIPKKVAATVAREGVRASALHLKGDAASQIVDLCGSQRIDLVAMATHGRSGVGRWVLGSVTEKVVRSAPVPVLVIRSGR